MSGRRWALLVALARVGAASAWGLAASNGAPKPVSTTHVVFTAVSEAASTGHPPCYPRPGLNVATGDAEAGAIFQWEMFASATPAQIAAQADCLTSTSGLSRVDQRIVTGPPGGRR